MDGRLSLSTRDTDQFEANSRQRNYADLHPKLAWIRKKVYKIGLDREIVSRGKVRKHPAGQGRHDGDLSA
jgi:hypothetical protein